MQPDSGQNQVTYCRTHGLDSKCFSLWKRKQREPSKQSKPDRTSVTRLVPVIVTPSASTSTSARTVPLRGGNWSMPQIAQQALADSLIVAGKPYAIGIMDGARARLHQMEGCRLLEADAPATLQRQAVAPDRWHKHFSASIFGINQPQFEAAREQARFIPEIDQIEQLYRVRDAAREGYGTDSLSRLTAHRTTIAENERVASDATKTASRRRVPGARVFVKVMVRMQ